MSARPLLSSSFTEPWHLLQVQVPSRPPPRSAWLFVQLELAFVSSRRAVAEQLLPALALILRMSTALSARGAPVALLLHRRQRRPPRARPTGNTATKGCSRTKFERVLKRARRRAPGCAARATEQVAPARRERARGNARRRRGCPRRESSRPCRPDAAGIGLRAAVTSVDRDRSCRSCGSIERDGAPGRDRPDSSRKEWPGTGRNHSPWARAARRCHGRHQPRLVLARPGPLDDARFETDAVAV